MAHVELVEPSDHAVADEIQILREFIRDYMQGIKDKIPQTILDYLAQQINKILIRLKQWGY